jgi:hypothetical protein
LSFGSGNLEDIYLDFPSNSLNSDNGTQGVGKGEVKVEMMEWKGKGLREESGTVVSKKIKVKLENKRWWHVKKKFNGQ